MWFGGSGWKVFGLGSYFDVVGILAGLPVAASLSRFALSV